VKPAAAVQVLEHVVLLAAAEQEDSHQGPPAEGGVRQLAQLQRAVCGAGGDLRCGCRL